MLKFNDHNADGLQVEALGMDGQTTFPPAGYLDKDRAAARLGIDDRTLRELIKAGTLDYAGTLLLHERRNRRVFAIDLLDAAVQRMRAAKTARATLPEGYIDRDETARRVGISPDTLALWFTNGRLRSGTWHELPSGRKVKIYPAADVDALRAKLAAGTPMREGFVDINGACRMFGVSKQSWVNWQNQGKLPEGEWGRSPTNKPCRIFPIDAVRAAMQALRGEHRVYREAGRGGRYHIPDGWVQLSQACEMLGVHANTFVRWEREGVITCGRNETGRRIKIYPRAELEHIIAENGRYTPPYPDPRRPGVYRVPLSGHDIQRREAIIDADDVPLIEGLRFFYSGRHDERDTGSVSTCNPNGPTRLHSLVMGVDEDGLCVSHHNGDPLDCRRANLVVRTRSQKNMRRRKSETFCGRPTTSQFKGVCWDRQRELWLAYIKKDGRLQSLGRYHDELNAAERYDEAAKELFGEHARLNFPNGIDAHLETECREAA